MHSSDARVEPQQQVGLAPCSTLGIGGSARWFVHATTPDEVAGADRWARDTGSGLFVLGGGSNLVIADAGIASLVLRVGVRGVDFTTDGADTLVTAGAGEPWDPLVQAVVERGLAGLECLSGIPGTVGGTPIQNVGAYGQDVSETIEQVDVFDRAERTMRVLTAAACRFGYRMSRFKREDPDRFVVCRVTFRLRPGGPTSAYPDVTRYLTDAGLTAPTVADVREAVLAVRRRKGMVIDANDADTRSVGSFFMNPIVDAASREHVAAVAGSAPPAFAMEDSRVKIPAAWLIEHAGFTRGHTDGQVGISSKHTLALVNRGGATARDVLRLATRIKRAVGDRFGISIRPEPVFVGFEGDPEVAYLQS